MSDLCFDYEQRQKNEDPKSKEGNILKNPSKFCYQKWSRYLRIYTPLNSSSLLKPDGDGLSSGDGFKQWELLLQSLSCKSCGNVCICHPIPNSHLQGNKAGRAWGSRWACLRALNHQSSGVKQKLSNPCCPSTCALPFDGSTPGTARQEVLAQKCREGRLGETLSSSGVPQAGEPAEKAAQGVNSKTRRLAGHWNVRAEGSGFWAVGLHHKILSPLRRADKGRWF